MGGKSGQGAWSVRYRCISVWDCVFACCGVMGAVVDSPFAEPMAVYACPCPCTRLPLPHPQSISKVSEKAGKEYQIEQALDKMSSEWENVNLFIDPYVRLCLYMCSVHACVAGSLQMRR